MFYKKLDAGISAMLLSSFFFAVNAFFVRILSDYMSSLEVFLFRSIISVLLLVATFIWLKPVNNKGGRPFLLVFRGLIGTFGGFLYFYNIFTMPMADALTFSKTSPIFTAILAFLFLKERMKKLGWIAVFIGFIGIVFIVQPSLETNTKYVITGILSGLLAGIAYTSVKELNLYYDNRIIVLSFATTGTLASAIFLFLGEFVEIKSLDFMLAKFVMPSGIAWLYIFIMGFLATLSQYFMTKSYSLTKAGVASAVSYSNILFGSIFGLLLGDAFPDLSTSLGILLVVLAGVLVARFKV